MRFSPQIDDWFINWNLAEEKSRRGTVRSRTEIIANNRPGFPGFEVPVIEMQYNCDYYKDWKNLAEQTLYNIEENIFGLGMVVALRFAVGIYRMTVDIDFVIRGYMQMQISDRNDQHQSQSRQHRQW